MRPNYRALSWAHTFDLDIDIKPALDALTASAEKGEAPGEAVLALAVSSLYDDDYERALEILLRYDAAFDSEALKSKGALIRFEALQRLGRPGDEIEAALRSITDPVDRKSADLALAHNAPTKAEAIERLHSRWITEHDSIALLSACEYAYREKDWQFLRDNGPQLFSIFKNLSSARFAIYGAFNVQDYASVESLLGELNSTGIQIPVDLSRLRAAAMERTGNPAAVSAYDALLDADASDRNFQAAGYSRLRRGDYAGVAALAQRVEGLQDLTARTALNYASWLRPSNPDLARSLWRRAMSLGVPEDELVLLAFHLAHELGLSAETQLLQEPMVRLGTAGAAGITMLSQEDALEALRKASERSATLFNQYRAGQLPVHLFCSATNATFLRTHVLQPRANEANSTKPWTPVFVRHGGRRVENFGKLRRTPYFDITSYLIAVDLGLLDLLIEKFNGIRISDNLATELANIHSNTAINEAQLEAFNRTLRVSERVGVLDIPYGQFEGFKNRDITVVDWDTPENRANYESAGVAFCTPATLIESMGIRGLINQEKLSRVRRSLGNLTSQFGSIPAKHTQILLRFNVTELFAESDAYSELMAAFRVNFDKAYLEHAKRERLRLEFDAETARWLDKTIEDLRAKITSEKLIRVQRPPSGDDSDNEPLDVRLALSLFSDSVPKDSFIVVDDRNITGYAHRDDGVPIVSLWDALGHLRDNGLIDDNVFFETTSVMRRRGFMYIPITAAEIEHFVKAASVIDRSFIPNVEMKALSRYIALSLLDTDALYARDPAAAQGPGMSQAAFVFDAGFAVRKSLKTILSVEDPASYARASWIFENLSVEGLPGYGMAGFFGTAQPTQTTIDVELAAFLGDIVSS